ncbi:MAG: uroporphyrinogen decarboxylase [Rhizobiaceae bacterium]
MEKRQERKLLSVIDGESLATPPVWLMRQAGRYLPEYRATRAKAGGFLDLCYTPELACEVTLQPIRRFGFDAAILFSDILVIPDALGRKVRFEEGRGPLLEPISAAEIGGLVSTGWEKHLQPVFDAVSLIRESLPGETALLGFCGAPWTVATYMIAGHGTPDQAPARLFSYRERQAFSDLIDLLADVSAEYLIEQFQHGADAVQIFDSWSGVLGEEDFSQWCVKPVKRMISAVRRKVPDARIIAFPKGAGSLYDGYREETEASVLGLDWSVPFSQARRLQAGGAVQGNLDPMRVVAGGRALDEGVDQILEALGDGPLIFNLGHGITPDAPVEHVERLMKRIRHS